MDDDKKELQMPQQPAEDILPEGGIQAWLAVLGGFLVQFSMFGYTNAFGVYNDYYTREFLYPAYTSSQISWIGSVQLMLTLSLGLITGKAFDRGYFYYLMIIGCVLFAFCIFMLSLARPEQFYQVFLSQGIGMGVAIGVTYVPSIAITAHYFKHRRSIAMGIISSGSAIGGALQPIMLNKVIYGAPGFHAGVRYSGYLNLGVLVIALLCMRTRLEVQNTPPRSVIKDFATFGKDAPFVFMALGTVMMLCGLFFPMFFLQLKAIKNGIDPNLAFYILPVLNAGSIIGRILPTLFINRVGVFNVVIPCVLACNVLIWCTLGVENLAGTYTIAILYGIASGAYIGVLAPMVSSLARSPAEIGSRMGTCFAFTGIGGLIGSPIAGALLTTSYIWWRPIVFAGSCVSTALLLFSTTRVLLVRRKGTYAV